MRCMPWWPLTRVDHSCRTTFVTARMAAAGEDVEPMSWKAGQQQHVQLAACCLMS
jgi:hypothetical protein